MMVVTEWLCLARMLQEELPVSPWDHCCGAETLFFEFFSSVSCPGEVQEQVLGWQQQQQQLLTDY